MFDFNRRKQTWLQLGRCSKATAKGCHLQSTSDWLACVWHLIWASAGFAGWTAHLLSDWLVMTRLCDAKVSLSAVQWRAGGLSYAGPD